MLAQHAGAAAVFGFGLVLTLVLARRERHDGRRAVVPFHLFDGRNLMASVNKVILLGNLGRDPETRYTTGGDAVTNLNIATSEQWKDKSGEKQERTEWHRVVLFGRQAEIAGEYLKKGRSVYIEGRLQTRKYTDKDGVEKYSTEIVGDRMQLIGGARDGGGGGDVEFSGAARWRRRRRGASSAGGAGARWRRTRRRKTTDDFDDDIPF